MESLFKWAVAFIATAISFLYGEWTMLLQILLALVIIDYVSGILAAGMSGQVSSRVGLMGIARKIFIFVMVAVSHQVDKILLEVGLETESLIMTASIVFYLVNELISITENAGRMDLPVPKKLKQAIEILKGEDQ
ncbi:holin family protein [Halalkalibacter sp. APA_J-10(15)]|uniref:phage holin family protein n=1 Tax=Halalkalibacter sp. APA_J-10(15) TaxID=2933805 RepID=UPI001FF6A793|nr:phage holin family protein [Halalkalibacter sp. APA_J-10(15)]MCK0471387.1 phage holin family protein [Halalkalibacter sp. APA_J-10(15)]